MDFLRRHSFFLLCGVVGLGAVVAAAMGVVWMGGVQEQMGSSRKLYDKLHQYQLAPGGSVVNDKAVEVMGAKIQKILSNYKDVLAESHRINSREPLMEGAFPTPANDTIPILFRNSYLQARQELPIQMDARLPPDDQDVQIQLQQIQEDMEAEAAANIGRAPGAGGLALPGGALSQSWGQQSVGPPSGEKAQQETYDPRRDAELRAALAKARAIRCYHLGLDETFGIPPFEEVGPRPTLEQMWHAQLCLWIQKDVAEAIARTNEEAAAAIEAANQEKPENEREQAWVGNMPVKALLRLDVSEGYVVTTPERSSRSSFRYQQSGTGRSGGQLAIGQYGLAFTERSCNSQYDVVHFHVEMVIDSRDLLRVVDGLCREKFFVPFRVSYGTVANDPRQTGMVYGEEPVVEVSLDFEAYFFTEIYRPMMPESVRLHLTADTEETRGRRSRGGASLDNRYDRGT